MALKPLNSVGGFSVGEVPANVILANADITANNATFNGNVLVSPANNAAYGVLTNNLYYANGVPWDFQQAAGSNGEIQYNMGDDFAASANFVWDQANNVLLITGNANVSGTLNAGAIVTSGIANGNSNLAIPVANGNVNVSVAGNANVLVVTGTGANVAGYFDASGNIEGANLRTNDGYIESTSGAAGLYLVPGSAAQGIVGYGKFTPNANVAHDIGSTTNNWANVYANNAIIAANVQSGNANVGNLLIANFGNFNNNVNVTGDVFAANIQINVAANISNLQVANFVTSNLTPTTDNQYSLGTTLKRWKELNIAGNANIAVATVTGNLSAGNVAFGNALTGNFGNFTNDLVVQGNIANANNIFATNHVNANNATFTANLTSGNANLGNLATANYMNIAQNVDINGSLDATNANFVGNIAISNSNPAYGILTDNLYYANGQPWDLQEAAGSNTEIQFNSNDNFDASANFTFDPSTNVLKVTGNANVTDTVITPNVNSLSGNLALISNNFSTVFDNTGNVTFPAGGTVTVGTLIGNVQANITVTAANTTVLFSDAGLVDGSTGFTFNKTSNLVSMTGNVDLGPAGQNQLVNLSNTALEVRGGWNSNAGAVNIVAGDYSNSTLWGKLAILGNYSGNAVGFSEANAFVFTSPGYGAGNVVRVDVLNTAAANTTSGALQVAGGLGVTGNGYFGNLSVTGDIANANNISVTNTLNAVTGNFSGNVNSLNANLGNLVLANFVNVASNLHTANANVTGTLTVANANISSNLTVNNLTVNLELAGNTANLIGNVVLSGAQVTVNNHLAGNTANFSGNITSLNANLGNIADANYLRTGEIYNGNSNVVITPNGNISLSATGTGNVVVVSNVGANVTGYVTANGNGTFGAVKSNSVTAQGGNLELYSFQSGDTYIQLRPYGNGTVDVGNTRITSLATPNAASDAATKQYVDDVAQGLNVHDSCYAATANTLAILTGGTITYNNGTAGVGANLVLSGSPTANYLSANVFDGNTQTVVGSRILVKNEANAAHNGVYVVDSSTVLTRASDYNTVPEVEAGDFIFVQDGTTYNDSGWVQTSVVTTIGTDPINFTQFSGAGTYQAGAGLTLTGTVFSVNVDNVTTEISGGNVIVKANAQLTTPNIGAATGTSLDLTGNVLAGNVNSNAKVTAANVEVSSNIIAGNISANANLVVSNATVNLSLTGNTANFSGNVVVPNLTVNLELQGNTANFDGNVVMDSWLSVANTANVGNLRTDNLLYANGQPWDFQLPAGSNTQVQYNDGAGSFGASANFTFDVATSTLAVTGNANISQDLNGNVGSFTGNMTVNNLLSNGLANVGNLHVVSNVTSALTPNANLTLDLGSSSQRWQDVYVGNIDGSGNLTLAGNISANNFTSNILTANTKVDVGNTAINWGTVTTTAITANQTISTLSVTGVTGVEWVVKGVDSSGAKYSMAIVTAVTDGGNVDYSTFGGVNLGSTTGTLAVNIVGSNVELQVTPSSSNSTVWVTQYRTI